MRAHPHVFCGTRSGSPFCYPFSLAPRLPQDQAASTGFNQLGCAPRERPHGWPLFPPVEFLPLAGYGKQKEQGSCRGGVAGLGICYPALAASLSLFSLSFSNSLNFDAACNALVFVWEMIVAVKRKLATENRGQRQGMGGDPGRQRPRSYTTPEMESVGALSTGPCPNRPAGVLGSGCLPRS